MKRSGEAYLPLHDGYVPRWLYDRMVRLGTLIVRFIIEEFRTEELLKRLGDPVWFQALGCSLGFDWHSSGLTTVVTAALKDAVSKGDYGLFIAGGKGKLSRRAPEEILRICGSKRLDVDPYKLIKISRLVAKVDNSLLLDGYNLYHHTLFFDEEGNWSVIQQGMNIEYKYARRYHWTSFTTRSLIVEPHSGLIGDHKHKFVMDLTSRKSDESRKVILDILKEKNRVKRDLIRLRDLTRGDLDKWIGLEEGVRLDNVKLLYMPRSLNWRAIRKAYEIQPRNYEELLEIEGIGPTTFRALALISEIIYGTKTSKQDPIRYTFAVGGKDAIPYPINRKVYDEVISYYEYLLEKIDVDKRREIIHKLSSFLPKIIKV